MCVTPNWSSQSDSASRSRVIVPNVRIVRSTRPSDDVTSTQATTVFLWTSSPQHRSCSTCIADLPVGGGRGGVRRTTSFPHVLVLSEDGDNHRSWTHPGQLRYRALST